MTKDQSGFTLTEILISIFLSSIIILALIEFYLTTKSQYLKVQEVLDINLDWRWVGELLSDSIRRAGFTPCLGVDQLQAIDMRYSGNSVTGFKIANLPQQYIQINRMSEFFGEVRHFRSPTQIIVNNSVSIDTKRPIIIADCEHAEIHEIWKVDSLSNGNSITLKKPLIYSYSKAYLGEWLEERWFISKNPDGYATLHYQLHQSEELSTYIHSLRAIARRIHGKQIIELVLGLEQDKEHKMAVVVRGS